MSSFNGKSLNLRTKLVPTGEKNWMLFLHSKRMSVNEEGDLYKNSYYVLNSKAQNMPQTSFSLLSASK